MTHEIVDHAFHAEILRGRTVRAQRLEEGVALIAERVVARRHHEGRRQPAEIGRQPWVVHGHLRTADAVSPIAAGAVTASLLTFIVVYAFIFGFGSYYLAKLLRRGPDPVEDIRGDDLGKKPKRPFSLPDEGIEGRPGHRAQPAE